MYIISSLGLFLLFIKKNFIAAKQTKQKNKININQAALRLKRLMTIILISEHCANRHADGLINFTRSK